MKQLIKFLLIWHRRLGVAACLFVLILAVTGILLNHTDALKLDKIQISQPSILSLYGIPAAPPIKGIQYKAHFFYQADHYLYADEQLIDTVEADLAGVVQRTNNNWVIATSKSLLLLDQQFRIIETLDESYGLPTPITGLTLQNNTLYIEVNSQQRFSVDADTLNWEPVNLDLKIFETVKTYPLEAVPNAVANTLYNTIPLERVLLDLHSGRLFGNVFVYIMDFSAILLIILSLSGLTIWLHIRRIKQRHHKR